MKISGNSTIEDLFVGQPRANMLFDAVRKSIEPIGPVDIEVSKTQVSFGVKTKFAWVWLPQKWIKKRKENNITLTFSLSRHIQHERIEKAVEPYPGRWTHHVIIKDESDLSDDVREWLYEAYNLAQNRRTRRRSIAL